MGDATHGSFSDGLNPDDAAALADAGTPRHYRRGETLFRAGDAGGFVVVITSGRVKVVAAAPNGTEAVLSTRGAGDLVGEVSTLEPVARMATVVALEPVRCRVLRSAEFVTLLVDRPEIAIALLRTLSSRLREADRRIVEFAAYDTVRRLARLLVEMAQADSGVSHDEESGVHVLRTGLTQDDLAGMVGASRESVARALGTLRSLGLVTTGRGHIDVHDLPALQTFGD